MANTEIGRLAMRVEGKWWVAYYAKLGTMADAIELGRLRMTIAEMPGMRDRAIEFYKSVFADMAKDRLGASLTWPTPPQSAPEHEKAGNA